MLWKQFGPKIREFFGASAGMTEKDWAKNAITPFKRTDIEGSINSYVAPPYTTASIPYVISLSADYIDYFYLACIVDPANYSARLPARRPIQTQLLSGSTDYVLSSNSGGNLALLLQPEFPFNDVSNLPIAGIYYYLPTFLQVSALNGFNPRDFSVTAGQSLSAASSLAGPLASMNAGGIGLNSYRVVSTCIELIPIISVNSN